MTLKSKLDRLWYPEHQDEWDGRAFRERILAVLTPQARVLDIGAGRGATPHMHFKGMAAEVAGVDVDDAVLKNPQLDRAVHSPDGALSAFEDSYFDLVISKDVLEHLVDPATYFREVRRVLKPGGLFMGKTPSGSHYVTIIARLTPLSFHKAFNRMRGREVEDTFPTMYRANSRGALARWAKEAGLTLVRVDFQEGRPEYLRFNPVTYFCGLLYERTVNLLGLDPLKAVIYVTMRKD
jgi:2-polyprenyl-3-methyl-5-hydroxy-6-metoxy-1,4-benzoquinol methylase